MRTLLLSILFSTLLFNLKGQVPNGSFEDWSVLVNAISLDGWQVNNGMLPDTKVKPDTQYVCLDSLSMQVGPGGAAATGFPIDSTIKSLSFCLSANIDTPDTAFFYILTYSAGVRIDSIPSLVNIDIGPLFDVQVGFNETTPLDSVYVLFTGGNKIGTSMWVDNMQVDTAIVSSIKEPVKTGSLKIYPNPATNTLAIDLPGGRLKSAQVYSIQGRQVQSNTNFQGNTLDISSLQPGIYLLMCTDKAGKVYSERFVKR